MIQLEGLQMMHEAVPNSFYLSVVFLAVSFSLPIYTFQFLCIFIQAVGGLPSGHRGSEKAPCEADRTQQTDLCWRAVP